MNERGERKKIVTDKEDDDYREQKTQPLIKTKIKINLKNTEGTVTWRKTRREPENKRITEHMLHKSLNTKLVKGKFSMRLATVGGRI